MDAETIQQWRREHERVIAESQPGSYSEHVSRQMLMVLDALDAAGPLLAAAREYAAAKPGDESVKALIVLMASAAALAVQPAESGAGE